MGSVLRIVAGCPVKDRSWIIDAWIRHVDAAIEEFDEAVDLTILFVGDKNDSTALSLMPLVDAGSVMYHYIDEGSDLTYKRSWSKSRYDHMVFIRNILLSKVRELSPDYFLSIDSDILVHPSSIKNLIETQRNTGAWAVGGKAFMSGGCGAPSYGVWYNPATKGNFKRTNCDQVKRVDVIMAYKLMTPQAYNIDYQTHATGEDAGWSSKLPYGKIYWDGRVTNKHIMEKHQIEIVDNRCGY